MKIENRKPPSLYACATFEFHGSAKNTLAKGGVFFELATLIAAQLRPLGFDASEPVYKGPVAKIVSSRDSVWWTILIEALGVPNEMLLKVKLEIFPSHPRETAGSTTKNPGQVGLQELCNLVDACLRSSTAINAIRWIPQRT